MGEFAEMECPDCGAQFITYKVEYHCGFCHGPNLKPKEQRPMSVAVFPGTFDPIHKGHIDIILRGLKVFGKIHVVMGVNPGKKQLFSEEERLEFINSELKYYGWTKLVDVTSYPGLMAPFVKEIGANAILRGMRPGDLDFEYQLNSVNRFLGPVETVHLVSSTMYSTVSSSLIKFTYQAGGRTPLWVCETVNQALIDKYEKEVI